jgi:hypothetical protein
VTAITKKLVPGTQLNEVPAGATISPWGAVAWGQRSADGSRGGTTRAWPTRLPPRQGYRQRIPTLSLQRGTAARAPEQNRYNGNGLGWVLDLEPLSSSP